MDVNLDRLNDRRAATFIACLNIPTKFYAASK